MPYSKYDSLSIAIDNRVATVTLNRPDTLNAVDGTLHHELATIFWELGDDPAVSVIVLTGAGRAFCAGGDLKWVKGSIETPLPFTLMMREGKKIVMGILECPKPIICRLNGDAIGFGATVALLSDIIIAVDTARIADPHVRIGLVAGDGGALIWPQLIGFAKAKEFLLTGNSIDAKEAARIGLINYAVSEDELDATVGRFVKQIANGSQSAIRYTKQAVNIPLRQLVASVLDCSLACEGLTTFQNGDLREGLDAFMNGRKPNYSAS
ncbi:enoyl-CoA hydratase/isomerase family protein [Ferribacterium limneticum]|uniref:enoyl-CoA hydratase/isomerase family protein n=1 Tax=Ferribacterium limneticum TaxID=76259 RepID=UPI001CF85433|nr:enoyl-CoA hydratase-related protein [Ferribacterium limneticum]UCV23637.1 enoyl-CoA hydratase/isomerase family protein [Ferribacterium limneticum]